MRSLISTFRIRPMKSTIGKFDIMPYFHILANLCRWERWTGLVVVDLLYTRTVRI